MRYIIKREWPTGVTKYVYSEWPSIKFIDDETLALRMTPERAAKTSYSLMLAGVTHTIQQVSQI